MLASPGDRSGCHRLAAFQLHRIMAAYQMHVTPLMQNTRPRLIGTTGPVVHRDQAFEQHQTRGTRTRRIQLSMMKIGIPAMQ